MAEYPLTPLKLSTLDATLPTGDEDASRIDDALRQTRHIFKEILKLIVDDDGTLLAAPTVAANSVDTAAVVDGAITAGKLKQTAASEAVVTAAIRDGAVTEVKLADGSVTENKLGAGAVTSLKINAGAVDTAALGTKAVTDAKLANHASDNAQRAVGSDHVKDSAITETKIASSVVSAGKLKSAASNSRMYWDTGSAVELLEIDPASVIIPAKDGGTGKLKFGYSQGEGGLFSNTSFIEERTSAGTSAGDTANGYVNRPATNGSYVIVWDPWGNNQMVELTTVGGIKAFKIKRAGRYWLNYKVAAYNLNGLSFAVLCSNSTTGSGQQGTIFLETGAANTGTGQMGYLEGSNVYDFTANTVIYVQHWATGVVTNGLGLGVGAPLTVNRFAWIQVTWIA